MVSWDELDLYGGFSGGVNNIGYDFGVITYLYPDSMTDVDFTELNMSVSLGMFSLGYAVLADAEGADFGDDSYFFADISIDLAEVTMNFILDKVLLIRMLTLVNLVFISVYLSKRSFWG